MTFTGRMQVAIGAFDLGAEVNADPGETVVIVGPNGAGKTALLRAVAGLLPLDSGRIELDDVVLDDPATGAWVPTERRPIGFVFQDGLLFPHLSALENVAFGLRARRMRRSDARRHAAEWLERLGLADRVSARPGTLSGGQVQRVALARALAVEPRLLLLDEPLAALDATTRREVRRELRRALASYEGARLLVTHDPVEALALADRLVVLEEGRVVQTGTPDDVWRRPRSRYVADLVGLNLFRGRASGGRIVLPPGGELVAADATSGDVFAVVHPRTVALYRHRPEGTPRNVWSGAVEQLEPEGDRVRVLVGGTVSIAAEVTPAAVAELSLAPGVGIWWSVKATEIDVYPA